MYKYYKIKERKVDLGDAWRSKSELSEKTLNFIFTNVSATDSFSLHCINIVGYNRSTFNPHEH